MLNTVLSPTRSACRKVWRTSLRLCHVARLAMLHQSITCWTQSPCAQARASKRLFAMMRTPGPPLAQPHFRILRTLLSTPRSADHDVLGRIGVVTCPQMSADGGRCRLVRRGCPTYNEGEAL